MVLASVIMVIGVFTWLIGVLGDRFGIQGAFFLLPATLVLYILILLFDAHHYRRRTV